MFAKLLKHEIKSHGGMLGLLSLGALAAGVIGGFLVRFGMVTGSHADAYELLSILSAVVLPVIFMALVAYAIGGEIYLAVQFYKSKFTDQGYLTFTLPVRAWQIYLASLLNMILWTLVIFVVMIVAFACIFFIGIYNTEVWYKLTELSSSLSQELDIVLSEINGFSPLYSIAEFISSNVLLITSITLGSVLAKKHKVLGAIGSYYGISMLISTVNSFVSTIVMYAADPQMDLFFLTSAALNAVVAVGGSILSIWLMDRHLNLP